MCHTLTPAQDFLSEVRQRSYGTILADPLWQFSNRTGKMAPEHRRLSRIKTPKREHSRKPDERYAIIEACSPGPFLERFARGQRVDWDQWGNEVVDYAPSWPTYANHSQHGERQRA
jgi:hypothetical protein